METGGGGPGDDSAGHGAASRTNCEALHLCPADRAGGGHAPPTADTGGASSPTASGSAAVGGPLGGCPLSLPLGALGEPGESLTQVPAVPTVVRASAAAADSSSRASVSNREWSTLPSDFRLQLQVFDKVSKQAHLLERLTKQQETATMRLADLSQQMSACEDTLQKQTLMQVDRFREEIEELKKSQERLLDAVNASIAQQAQCSQKPQKPFSLGQIDVEEAAPDSPHSDKGLNPADVTLEDPKEEEDFAHRIPEPIKGQEMIMGHRVSKLREVPRGRSVISLTPHDLLRRIPTADLDCMTLTRRYFKDGTGNSIVEGICAAVIVANAISMGFKAEIAAHKEIKGDIGPNPLIGFLEGLEHFFVAFYTVEFIFKCLMFRKDMFVGNDWKWNWFDMLLLSSAYFEYLADIMELEQKGVDVTWMRLLRLLKMLKMLRVVRVMRLFRELRTMLSSIVGSIATLMWSLLMIFLITYIFGLIFLQAVTGFLEVRPRELVDEETFDNIDRYWCGVGQAVVTLYMAVTGGSDWEPLAQPFQVMPGIGQLYYFIFLLYIAFAMIAVLNVLTGMFVDAAMKVAVVDENNVLDEILEKDAPQLDNFKEFLLDHDDGHGNLVWQSLIRHWNSRVVKDFLKAFEMEPKDLKKIYKMLNFDGKVSVDEFVDACCKCRGAAKDIDTLGMHAEIRKYAGQLGHLMEYLEERFEEIHGFFSSMGAPESRVMPLKHRLLGMRALPVSWAEKVPASEAVGMRVPTWESSPPGTRSVDSMARTNR